MVDVWWQVVEIVGQGYVIGDGLGFFVVLFDGGVVGFVGEQGQFFQFQWFGFLVFVVIEYVQVVGQGFYQQMCFCMGIVVFYCEIVEGQCGIGVGQVFEG